MQPGKAALDHPALFAEAGAARDPAAGDPRSDPASPQLAAVDVVVVAAVGEQLTRSAAGPAASPADRRRPPPPRGQRGAWLRLPPGGVAGSGMPAASTIRWCLEPGRPRSTGEGPTWSPL